MKYYNGDQKNGKTLRDIQNIKINRKLPNIYNMLVSFMFIFIFRMSCYKFMIFWIRLLIVLSMYSFLCIILLFFVMRKQKNGNLALLRLGLYIKHPSLHHFSPTPNRRQKPDTESYIYIQNKMLYSENNHNIIF